MRIGIFGGTFDPIHKVHLKIAIEFASQFRLDELRVVPAIPAGYRKNKMMFSDDERIRMIQSAVDSEDEIKKLKTKFICDDFEISLKEVSCTANTMRMLSDKFKGDHLLFLSGFDSFATISSWENYQSLFDYCDIVLANRPGYELKGKESEIFKERLSTYESDSVPKNGRIFLLNTKPTEMSSTQIRSLIESRTVETENKLKKMLPPQVSRLIG